MMLVTAMVSCVLAFGYDLGHGTGYAHRALIALVVVIGARVIRAYQEA